MRGERYEGTRTEEVKKLQQSQLRKPTNKELEEPIAPTSISSDDNEKDENPKPILLTKALLDFCNANKLGNKDSDMDTIIVENLKIRRTEIILAPYKKLIHDLLKKVVQPDIPF